jgi:hypothetical protein
VLSVVVGGVATIAVVAFVGVIWKDIRTLGRLQEYEA